jgi:hypothetical protein
MPFNILLLLLLLTAIGLMPGGSVTKIGRTYKKWTYITRKQNIQVQLTTKQHVHLTKRTSRTHNAVSLKLFNGF